MSQGKDKIRHPSQLQNQTHSWRDKAGSEESYSVQAMAEAGRAVTFHFDHDRLRSAASLPIRLTLLTIGLCKDLAGEEKLKALGIERIWRIGNGSESLADAVYDFRGRSGTLAVADDLRIFSPNDSNFEIAAVCAGLLRLKIEIVDINHPEEVVPEMQERARKAFHSARPMPNHRIARRRGRMGGLARAAAAEIARATRCAADIAERICRHEKLAWADRLEILGEGFTMSSIQRHYR